MFTVDASVHVSAQNPTEDGSDESRRFLARLYTRPWPVYSPTLLLVEVAAALSRVFDDPDHAMASTRALQKLPGQIWTPLDEPLAEEAARFAADCRVRGSDAVYAAVARRYGTILVTLDRQQLERLSPVLRTLRPAEALAQLEEMERAQAKRD